MRPLRRLTAVALPALLAGILAGVAWGQAVSPTGPAAPPEAPHGSGELDCRRCHVGQHRGVVSMFLGTGGRGTPVIPSHMLQVRVECVACHIVPKEQAERAGLVGQTFRPSEQACLACHGDKYRGMLERWSTTLGRMQAVIAPKLGAARDALAAAGGVSAGARQRAGRLVDDAEFNVRFVALGRGVHNVFYAADLLKLANGWLDEAIATVGKAPAKVDDTLVRGGYCAVLCHEQAGVKQRETVSYGRQRLPHVRHVAEFGAVCTSCHSAEMHKAVTAQPATCAGCHHSPQNERCQGCHPAQRAFYRGEVSTALVKAEPNVMAAAVGCTGCHDFARKHSRRAVTEKCLGCHDAAYASLATEWTAGLDRAASEAGRALTRAEAVLARGRRAGHKAPEAEAVLREAREVVALVRKARGVHNPAAAEALLQAARQKADEAVARSSRP